MVYKMSEFQSIDPGNVVKLRDAGIENTDDLMRMWADQPKRAELVEKSGISLEMFANIASLARLARVKNVGPQFVAVLVAAGIDGPKSLFENTPESVVKRVSEAVAEKKLTSPVPTLDQIKAWYSETKPAGANGKAVVEPAVVVAAK